jgi:hypothetical protein
MNDASTGKLPSAGLAAKAIYALQYADEQSITEASALQDTALKQLAEALDADHARGVQGGAEDPPRRRRSRVHGGARDLARRSQGVDVDYTFTSRARCCRGRRKPSKTKCSRSCRRASSTRPP